MDTLHMELQIIGKVRLALAPFEPQWANVPLYLSARGLTTTPMRTGDVTFEVQADLINHQVEILTTSGAAARVPLNARPGPTKSCIPLFIATDGRGVPSAAVPCTAVLATPKARDGEGCPSATSPTSCGLLGVARPANVFVKKTPPTLQSPLRARGRVGGGT